MSQLRYSSGFNSGEYEGRENTSISSFRAGLEKLDSGISGNAALN
jgi:hypothetical protein